jgi:hypothetical protein
MKMTEITLKGMLDNEIDNALGYLDTETTEQRRQAIKAYNRDPYGNEVEGRSQIVTGEVAEAIDGALPQLLRIFTQSDDVARFEPKGPGDEPKAKQATEYCNWVLMNENPGVTILHDWFKDALTYKNGIIKVWWEDMTEVNTESYENLSSDELTMLLSDGQYEIVSQEEILVGEIPDPMTQMPVPVFAYNVKIKKIDKKGRVVIENLAPEEFIVSKKTRLLSESPFCAHRRLATRSELVAMGFDKDVVADLPTYNDLEYTTERVARFSNGEQPDDPSLDPSMQEVEVYEAYMKVDFDGDGIAELRRIVYAGQEILDNEEADYVPFCSICPIPMPHKFYGHSLADRVTDLQLIKTTITRQILDNLYLSNNSRMMVVDGQVNLDDMLTVTPGGVVRVKNPNAVQPLAVPLVAGQAFPMLDYMDQVQAKRTGVTDASKGLDPNILQNTTATAVAMMQNAGAARIELIARIFAETGVKDLFRNILHLVCKYQDKERIIRLSGKFVTIDPREWSNEYDLSINVGLGTGSREQQMGMLAMIMDKQEQILQQFGPANPLVSVGQYRQTLGRMIEAAGFKDSTEFFREITPEIDQMLSSPPPQQPQQDPMAQAIMAQTQAQVQAMMMKAEADIQAKMAKAEADIQIMREKAAADLQLKRQEFAVESGLEAAKVGRQIGMGQL